VFGIQTAFMVIANYLMVSSCTVLATQFSTMHSVADAAPVWFTIRLLNGVRR
jgi:hypothetical protein